MDKGSGRDPRRGNSAVGVIVAVAVLGVVMIGGVLVSGPLRAGQPRWLPTAGDGVPRPAAPAPFQTAVESPPPAQQAVSPAQLQQWLLWGALIAVVVAGILIYLIRRALRRSGIRSAERPGRTMAVAPAAPPSRTEEPAAPAVARGIDRALDVFEEAREPNDAIVRAWLGLQDAADSSGMHRRPAETPAEYTTRIIVRFGADREAAGVLLDLYQGVRFGGHPADEATVQTARECLVRLRDSWHELAGSTGGAS